VPANLRVHACVLVAALMLGCHPVVRDSDLRSELWDEWNFAMGSSSGGYEYYLHRRPRTHDQARTYFVFVDHRCRLVWGTLELLPFRKPPTPADYDEAELAIWEARWRNSVEPSGDPDLRSWQLPATGGYMELAPGTWTSAGSPQPGGWPWAPDWTGRVWLDLYVSDEHDTLVVMHHVVPPRIRQGWVYDEMVSQRLSHYTNRCFAGEDLEPRFDVQLEQAGRCMEGNTTCVTPGH
jgi:hypothetical protein